jgi:hypothetical protein
MKAKFVSVRRLTKPAQGVSLEFPVASVSHSFPVIAMAASVGGLKALSIILGGLPADFPAAIAIVMHVAPDHKSLLTEILKCRTQLQVTEAHTGDVLIPSKVFVAPPNHHLFVVKGDHLKLSSSHAEKIHFARPSAEPLFASVAEVYGKNAIAGAHRRRWRRLIRSADHQGARRHSHRARPAHVGKFQHAGDFHQDRRCGLYSTAGPDRTHVDRLGLDRPSTEEWSSGGQK